MIRARIEEATLANALPPLTLDMRTAEPAPDRYDAVYTCNTAHIMSAGAVERMLSFISVALSDDGVFLSYGPFKRGGRYNAPSNEAFDASLRSRDPSMGLRDLDDIDAALGEKHMIRRRIYAMPSNNLLVVWKKEAA